MFDFLKPKPQSDIQHLESVILHLSDLHCSSCAVDIDLALEELPSVSSTTNYAKSETKVSFDPLKVTLKEIKNTVSSLGYPTS